MIVAIDGPAGVGKSTIAKMIAERCDLFYINSGNFYRAVAYRHLSMGRDPEDREAIVRTAGECSFSIVDGALHLDGTFIEDRLHTPAIDMASSRFSSITAVRVIINEQLRRAAASLDVIMEGRDITTVVFPDADLKCYFDASVEIRARRRFDQFPEKAAYEEYLEDIRKRDENDRSKEFGALKRADDALYIDTSYLTIDEVCDKVVQKIFTIRNQSTGRT